MVRLLSIHAGYACRHSGACCTAGWRIPVEPSALDQVRVTAESGGLPRVAGRTESDGRVTVLALAPDGRSCTAFEPADGTHPALCAIHRVLGSAALPSACRQFPRVCLIDARGVSVTLSHFCPTAAGLLFENGKLSIVEDPPGFAESSEYEGLDARDALPPLLRPGLLMDVESYAAWEDRAVRLLDGDRYSPESALAALGAGVERLRTWTPRDGRLVDRVRACEHELPFSPPARRPSDSARRFDDLLACVPEGLSHPRAPEDIDRIDRELVAPAWPRWHRPLRRYLAARLHGSWVAYQGHGLRTVLASLSAALDAVRIEAARQCAGCGRRLDRGLLVEAIRAADRLLVHESDGDRLARAWSAAEREPR